MGRDQFVGIHKIGFRENCTLAHPDQSLTDFFFAELMDNFLKWFLSTASLNKELAGAERFKIGLTFVFCTAAIRGLVLNFLKGGFGNGPIT